MAKICRVNLVHATNAANRYATPPTQDVSPNRPQYKLYESISSSTTARKLIEINSNVELLTSGRAV